ncbi:GNAT family N-acetyltransferase [Haloprofundus salilacus]|uniref:GNAT family N-acetyltransferase n=1 Tax=Haloprofundus salilacus TaxID=2876190 RepID=UPI001CC95898|nr:GNAT family N-acetyltransferase [Haloprofundus salilacus]
MTASTEESHDRDDRDTSRSQAEPPVDGGSESLDAAESSGDTTVDDGIDSEPDREDASEDGAELDDLVMRPFETDDRDELLSLYETATGETPERFARRFVDNPFNPDETPILVAERDGELVGAHLSVAVRMCVGTDVVTARRTAGIIAHPEYGETDLADQLSSAAAERYVNSSTAFAFDFLDGDDEALANALAFGYRVVDNVPTYYRIRNPFAFTADRGAVGRALGRLGSVAARGYLAAKRRRIAVDRDLAVSRVDGVPAERLAALAERVDADDVRAVRAVRDAEFYDWRFDDSAESYRTYFAARDDETVAAVVVADPDENNRVELVDVLPAGPAVEKTGETAAIRTLLVAIAEQHADAEFLMAFGSAFPDETMRAAGFVRDDDYPLSLLTAPPTLVAYPYVDDDVSNADSWRCGGEMLTDGTVWTPTFAERSL